MANMTMPGLELRLRRSGTGTRGVCAMCVAN